MTERSTLVGPVADVENPFGGGGRERERGSNICPKATNVL